MLLTHTDDRYLTQVIQSDSESLLYSSQNYSALPLTAKIPIPQLSLQDTFFTYLSWEVLQRSHWTLFKVLKLEREAYVSPIGGRTMRTFPLRLFSFIKFTL